MMTFKYAIAPALVAASVLTMASSASAAPAMNGRPNLSAATDSQVTEVRWRRGNTAAAAGVGFAAGALIGAAAANSGSYYYGQPGYYGQPAYRSYNYYEPAPTYYEPAPSYYYGEPAYRGSYGYSTGRRNGPQNSTAAEQQRLQTGP
jgi:hypothetical protein